LLTPGDSILRHVGKGQSVSNKHHALFEARENMPFHKTILPYMLKILFNAYRGRGGSDKMPESYEQRYGDIEPSAVD
jgi:hypothetical protein